MDDSSDYPVWMPATAFKNDDHFDCIRIAIELAIEFGADLNLFCK